MAVSNLQRIDVPGQWTASSIFNEQFHLIVVLQGEGALSLDTVIMPLRAGELLVIDGRQRPELSAVFPYGGGLTIAHGVLSATLPDGRKLCDFIAMRHACAADTPCGGETPEAPPAAVDAGSNAIMICLMRRIVTRLLRERWSASSTIPDEKIRAQRQRLAKIIALMRNDPARPHTLESLADAAGMGRTAFHKMFTETFGNSPLAVLRDIRIRKAEELLVETGLPIKTISMRLGYRSRSCFWQAFKKTHGVPPEIYRNNASARSPPP
jgi:AraC-like DNA-binding protein